MTTTDAFPVGMEEPSFGSPIMVDRIGKLGGDWSMELSPIAPNRDSYSTGSEHEQEAAQSSYSKVTATTKSRGEDKVNTDVENDSSFSPVTDDDNIPATKYRVPIFSPPSKHHHNHNSNNKNNTKMNTVASVYTKNENLLGEQIPTKEEMERKPAWFLGAPESCPQLCTSAVEFSLELGSLSADSDDKSPQGQEASDLKDSPHAHPNETSPMYAAIDKSERKPAWNANADNGKGDSDHVGYDELPSIEEPSDKTNVASTSDKRDPEQAKRELSRGDTINVAESENIVHEEQQQTSFHDEGDDEQQRLSPDTDALLQDATEKVKHFIYELSVLEVSRQTSSSDSTSDNSDSFPRRSTSPVTAADTIPEGEKATAIEEATMPQESPKRLLSDTPSYDKVEKKGQQQSESNDAVRDDVNQTWSSPTNTKKFEKAALFQNKSMDLGNPSTPGKYDLTEAKKELGVTSFEFIQRLRGAAQRRKQNLARSRDSLVAKEKQQREAIAASKQAPKPKSPISSKVTEEPGRVPKRKSKTSVSTKSQPFKAKPLPAANGESGWGGMRGVPKVAKKPTTLPMSPLLGARRPNRPKVKALERIPTKPIRRHSVAPKKTTGITGGVFKALPVPPTNGDLGKSGQSGVPKVPKRPTTTPNSPCLGPSRRHSSATVLKGKENQKHARRLSTGMKSISSLSQASPVLLGLALLSTKSDYDETSAPVRTPENAPTTSSSGFEPRSTQRAKQRAEFDQRRAVNEQRRIEEEIRGREERVKVIHKELDTLREVI